jgi:Methyltransferase domain
MLESIRVSEPEYWKAVVAGLIKPRVNTIEFVPRHRQPPSRMLQVQSAWKGIESVLADIIDRFQLRTNRCLEFGVEYGYSTVALSSFFDSVIGIDTFLGDQHTQDHRDLYAETVNRLSEFENIRLIRSNFRDWTKQDNDSYDLVHVDIVHTYADTFACGLWSALHSQCTIFHDTEAFPAVKRAVIEISRRTGKSFHNFKESCGLGILV